MFPSILDRVKSYAFWLLSFIVPSGGHHTLRIGGSITVDGRTFRVVKKIGEGIDGPGGGCTGSRRSST